MSILCKREKIQFSPLLAAILDFLQKINTENIFKMVTDRAILSEFLTHRVVQQYSVPRGKMSSWILAENEKL